MKQHGNQTWSGHREITQQAVRRLFEKHGGSEGRIRGADEQEYFKALDKAQARQDRPLGAGLIRNYAGTSLTMPYVGPGPTTHSAWGNGEAQREHGMADPRLSGPENLRRNTDYVLDEMRAARQAAGPELSAAALRTEMTHLGRAAHALQDTFSDGHVKRDDKVFGGDPTAPIEAFEVFTPGHVVGLDHGRNTHHDAFDQPLAESGPTVAATEATFRILDAHETGLRTSPDQADLLMRQTLEPMFQASPKGVTVDAVPDARWRTERDRRLELSQQPASAFKPGQTAAAESSPKMSAGEVGHLTGMMAGQGGHPLDGPARTEGPGTAADPEPRWQDRSGPHQAGQRDPDSRSGR